MILFLIFFKNKYQPQYWARLLLMETCCSCHAQILYLTCTVNTYTFWNCCTKVISKSPSKENWSVNNITSLCFLCTFMPYNMAEDFILASTIPQETGRKMQSDTWNSAASLTLCSCYFPLIFWGFMSDCELVPVLQRAILKCGRLVWN